MNGENRDNITSFPRGGRTDGNGHGGGSRDGGNAGIVKRLVRLETKMENVATQKDISDLKTHISDKQNSTLKWNIATLVGFILALLAMLQIFSKGA